jgi:hypothetical protein
MNLVYLIFSHNFFKYKLIYNEQDDHEIRFVLDQHTYLDFYSASSLKQQSTDRHALKA